MSIWDIKNKYHWIYRERLNSRDFEQLEVMYYNESNISSPFTKDISIRIFMVLELMSSWEEKNLDVKGAFLRGESEKEYEMCYMEICWDLKNTITMMFS